MALTRDQVNIMARHNLAEGKKRREAEQTQPQTGKHAELMEAFRQLDKPIPPRSDINNASRTLSTSETSSPEQIHKPPPAKTQ